MLHCSGRGDCLQHFQSIYSQTGLTLEEEIRIDLGHCYQQLKPYFIREDDITVEEVKGIGEFGKLKRAKWAKSVEPDDATNKAQTDVALKFIKG